jgi:hypothetical protein
MVELLRTNDIVLISYVRDLLTQETIETFELDSHASVMDGSAVMIQRRVMVANEDEWRARQLLKAEGLGEHLKP